MHSGRSIQDYCRLLLATVDRIPGGRANRLGRRRSSPSLRPKSMRRMRLCSKPHISAAVSRRTSLARRCRRHSMCVRGFTGRCLETEITYRNPSDCSDPRHSSIRLQNFSRCLVIAGVSWTTERFEKNGFNGALLVRCRSLSMVVKTDPGLSNMLISKLHLSLGLFALVYSSS